MKTYYSMEQVSQMYGVSIYTVKSWVRRGIIPFRRIGRLIRFTENDLDSFEQREDMVILPREVHEFGGACGKEA